MDADIGVQCLQTEGKPFIFMKGMKAHAGFPEISYGKFSSMLVAKGYKVARVEQTQKASAVKGCVTRDVVAIVTPGTRTHTYLDTDIPSSGPLSDPSYLFTVTERLLAPTGTSGAAAQGGATPQGLEPVCEYGVCYVDSTTGSFRVGCFADGPQRNRLRTLLAKIRPKEVVFPLGGGDIGDGGPGCGSDLSAETMSILRAESHPDAVLTPQGPLVQRKQSKMKKTGRNAWNPTSTAKFFEKVYLQIDKINAEEEGGRETNKETARAIMPWVMRQMLVEEEGGGGGGGEGGGGGGGGGDVVPNEACALAWSAVGGLVAHLEHCLIAFQLLDQGTFDAYVPGDLANETSVVPCDPSEERDEEVDAEGGTLSGAAGSSSSSSLPPFMTLDVHAIRNLEIFENTYDRGTSGTLFEFLDYTKTPMGKRLYRSWIAAPLCRPSSVYKRLDAVEDLCHLSEERDTLRQKLSKIPDLEKLECSIHALGSRYVADDHPIADAIMYEEVSYMKKKYGDYHKALAGFEKCQRLMEEFVENVGSYEMKSTQLRQLIGADGEVSANDSSSAATNVTKMMWPNLTIILSNLRKAAPPKPEAKDLSIQMKPGMDATYDRLREEEGEVNNCLAQFLSQARRQYHATGKYFGKNKNSWQVEVPEDKNVPSSWEYSSKKKGFKRYYPREVTKWKERLALIAEGIEECQANALRILFRNFSRHHQTWKVALRCISRLDALMSLSVASEAIREGADGVSDQPTCRPEFVTMEDGGPVLELREARHPCIAATFSGNGFIPNDTILGHQKGGGRGGGGGGGGETSITESSTDNPSANTLLLTGPNMGGKSTVLRQTCICIIMAQLGCMVPATKCRLSPVDRIFTRIGASDNILQGQSTFFVELSETSTILHEATPHSLVILDELGRGTSTFDGVAIASSVVQKLAEDLGCRTMFATHYHSLVDEFSSHPNVSMANMACKVAEESEVNRNDENFDADSNVMFLYKLHGGPCSKSYGLNVARLARLPPDVLNTARAKSKQFEAAMVSVAKESLLAAILRLAEEIKEKGLNPTLEKKYQTLLGQARSVLGKEK